MYMRKTVSPALPDFAAARDKVYERLSQRADSPTSPPADEAFLRKRANILIARRHALMRALPQGRLVLGCCSGSGRRPHAQSVDPLGNQRTAVDLVMDHPDARDGSYRRWRGGPPKTGSKLSDRARLPDRGRTAAAH